MTNKYLISILMVGLMMGLLPSCSSLAEDVKRTRRLKYDPTGKKPTGKSIAIGKILDKRSVGIGKNIELDQKQIKISMEEVRRAISEFLSTSTRFDSTILLFPEFSGEKFSDALDTARKSDCDYLLVGAVTQFDIQVVGNNWRYGPSVAADLLIFPLTIIAYLLTRGHSLIFTAGLVAATNVEVRLSVVINLIDVRSGKIVNTLMASERIKGPATSIDMFGGFYNSDDDWIDLGRKLGRYVVHNTSVRLIDKVASAILKRHQKK